MKHGKGTLFYANGNIFCGEFKYDRFIKHNPQKRNKVWKVRMIEFH
jgi:hypothetical protein